MREENDGVARWPFAESRGGLGKENGGGSWKEPGGAELSRCPRRGTWDYRHPTHRFLILGVLASE